MAEEIPIAGIRFAPHGPLVFCQTAESTLPRGARVRVEVHGEIHEGVVAVAPLQIIGAPALPDAPRIVQVIPPAEQAEGHVAIPPDVTFLPAESGAIGPADLAEALRLAALAVPEPPAERR